MPAGDHVNQATSTERLTRMLSATPVSRRSELMDATWFNAVAGTLIDETTRRQTLGGLLGGAITALGIGRSWETTAREKRKKKSCHKHKQGRQVEQGKKHKKRKSCQNRDTPLASDPAPTLSPICPAPNNAIYIFQRQVGSQGTGNGEFKLPYGVAVAPDGTLYVVDNGNERIQHFSAAGTFLNAWESAFDFPTGIAVSPIDGTVYVCDSGNDRMQRFDADGNWISLWGSFGNGNSQFHGLKDVAVGGDGDVYVVDPGNRRIQRFTAGGVFQNAWGVAGDDDGEFNPPESIAVAPDGTVYVADAGNHRIQRFTGTGVFMAKWGSKGTGNGQFNSPERIDVAADGTVYVIDKDNFRIQRFSVTGAFLSAWGSESGGQFDDIQGIAVGPDCAVFVTDRTNHRVQVFQPFA
jgi:DNA-binding beta-propeller fold protein YncE